MAKRCADTVEIKLDTAMPLPPGLDGAGFANDSPGESAFDIYPGVGLLPPEPFIVAMNEVTTTNGYSAVDVVVEWDPVPGAKEYEMRLSLV